VLDAAATGAALGARDEAALRGLGYLVCDAGAAAEVTAAVQAALRSGAGGPRPGEVAGALVAVLEYGQRLRYALEWSRAQSLAVDAQLVWTLGIGLPVAAVPGVAGQFAGVAEDVLADAFDANGDVEIGPDGGRVRTGDDAARFAAVAIGPAAGSDSSSTTAAARLAFGRAGEVLGRLAGPRESLLDRLEDLPLPDSSHRPGRGR
jgi:hypothetical protein